MGLRDLTAIEQIAELNAGRVSSLELVDAHLEAIERDDVQAFLATDAEGARARAREIDAMPERPPLAGHEVVGGANCGSSGAPAARLAPWVAARSRAGDLAPTAPVLVPVCYKS